MEKLSRLILKLLGWKTIGGVVPEKKCIIIAAPHTSAWDFIICWLFYTSVGGKAMVLIKKEFFFWPVGYFLKAMGGLPIDRSRGANVIKQVVKEFETKDSMHLAITPEGTRKKTTKWKRGFHTIAKLANVPVYAGYSDFEKKEVGIDIRIELTNDINADIKNLRKWYRDKGVVAKFPENFSTGNDLD
jgi:1-acyl-sn-glycerol-3-phosphate acyltransferase